MSHNSALQQPAEQPVKRYQKGMYHRQYLAAAKNGIWGTEGGRCGGQVIEQTIMDVGLVQLPVLCDRWACDLCGVRRAAWLIRELREAQERHQLNYFWTLTVRAGTCTMEESHTLIKGWWNRLRGRLTREYGKFSYVWIAESQKSGYAHLHLLLTMDMSGSKLSALWREVTGGSWVVDVQPVESERASQYLAKYCSQQARQRAEPGYEHLKNKQLFNHSRDIVFAPFRKPGETIPHTNLETGEVTERSVWTVWPIPYWSRREQHKRQGLTPKVEKVQGVPSVVWVEPHGFG